MSDRVSQEVEIPLPSGRNLKIDGYSFQSTYTQKSNGFVVVDRNVLDVNDIASRLNKILNARGTDTSRRIRDIIRASDVSFVDRPEGDTPVRGAGVRMFGSRPLKRGGYRGDSEPDTRGVSTQMEKRAQKIALKAMEYVNYAKQKAESAESDRDRLIARVEIDQALTGGGYDNTLIHDTSRSGINFISKSRELPTLTEEQEEAVVFACKRLAEDLALAGLRANSLEPASIQHVRFEQTNDGLLGMPILKKGNLKASAADAKCLAVAYKVDASSLVGKKVSDPDRGETVDVRNQDLLGYVLDNTTFSVRDMLPIVILLTRIQRHGWKEKDGSLEAKPGKTRSVYPPSALEGAIGAMVFQPLQEALMKGQPAFMPSLMIPENRDRVMYDFVKRAAEGGRIVLSADESKFDASVIADVMATIMQLVIKPLFKAEYHAWVDVAQASLVYKVILLPSDMESELSKAGIDDFVRVKDLLVAPTINGLISGHKGTHIMGSFYTRAVLQYAAAVLMDYELPQNEGAAAGDDNAFSYPAERVDLQSAEKTYAPIADVYGQFGMELNVAKQIWHVQDDEPVTVFLQRIYHAGQEIQGVGSALRSIAGVWYSERDKRYSVAEQLMAELSIMQNGINSPFIKDVVASWLQDEQVLLAIYQKLGVETWYTLITAMGGQDAFTQSIDSGAFLWGVDPEKLQRGEPMEINSVAAEVASRLDPANVDWGTVQRLVLAESEQSEQTTMDAEVEQEL